MTHASIPLDHRRNERTVGSLTPGDYGWVTSWSVIVDTDWHVWLDPNATVHDVPMGTVDTAVGRDGEGWWVVAYEPEGGWSRRDVSSDRLAVARVEVVRHKHDVIFRVPA